MIYASVVLTVFHVFLSGTCRKIDGNRSVLAQKWNMSLLTYIHIRKQRKTGNLTDRKSRTSFKTRPNLLNSLKLFFDKETSILLLYSGLIYAGSCMMLSSISLCCLSAGSGTMAVMVSPGPSWIGPFVGMPNALELRSPTTDRRI
jgi:hypothetical protein